jgi:hypothetical protein
VFREIEHFERYYDAKVQASGSSISTQNLAVHFGSRSMARTASSDSDHVSCAIYPPGGIHHQWVPPSSVRKDDEDYQNSVLWDDVYL